MCPSCGVIKEGVLIFSKSRLAHPGGRRRAVPRIHGRGDDGGMLTCLLFRCLRFLGALRIRRRFAEWPVAQISEHFQTQTAFLVGPIFFWSEPRRDNQHNCRVGCTQRAATALRATGELESTTFPTCAIRGGRIRTASTAPLSGSKSAELRSVAIVNKERTLGNAVASYSPSHGKSPWLEISMPAHEDA